MITFFTSSKGFLDWILKEGFDNASNKLLKILGNNNEILIQEALTNIFKNYDREEAARTFFELFTNILNKGAKMEKSAQSRDRNGWERGMRNKWNSCVDNYDSNTPWKIAKEKMFGFNHYRTDDIVFDNDPNHVYSGEAIWRMYVMDKFSSECQDVKTGKWIGGYINDRFYVYPDGGTPSNKEVARDGGNQMGLPPGIKTMQPRPHQYSTERRLEELRGNKTESIVIESSSKKIIKSASLPKERNNDINYNVIRDTLDMRENGFSYEDILTHVSDHYKISISSVAKIDKIAQGLKEKHNNVFYGLDKESQLSGLKDGATYTNPNPVEISANGQKKTLNENSNVVCVNPDNMEFQIVDGQDIGEHFNLISSDTLNQFTRIDTDEDHIQSTAEDLGLSENTSMQNEQENTLLASFYQNKLNKQANANWDLNKVLTFIKKTSNLHSIFLKETQELDEETVCKNIWDNIITSDPQLKSKYDVFANKFL